MDSENTEERPCQSFWDLHSSSDDSDDETNEQAVDERKSDEQKLRRGRSGSGPPPPAPPPPPPAPEPPTQQTPDYSRVHKDMAEIEIGRWLRDFAPCPEETEEERFHRICKNLGLPYLPSDPHPLTIKKLEKQLFNSPKVLLEVLRRVQAIEQSGVNAEDIKDGPIFSQVELVRDILNFEWTHEGLRWMLESVR